jgi:CRISPR-associated protein Csd1
MLLTALKAYSDANQDSALPAFYDMQEARYRIDLDRDGNLISFTELSDPDNPRRGVKLAIPCLKRTSSIVPLILDRGDYLLGISQQKPAAAEQIKADARTLRAHEAYVDQLADAAASTDATSLRALLRFAKSFTPGEDDPRLPEGFVASAFIAVYVDGQLVSEDPQVRRWWANRQSSAGGSHDDSSATVLGKRACGVCGRFGDCVEFIPVGIRGFGSIGGTATMALISGNKDVFERHGMPRANGASVCLACGTATHEALNRLLSDATHCKRLGNSKILWWATDACPDLLAAILEGQTEGAVGEVLSSIVSGRRRLSVDSARFYSIALGASKARIVVRSWIDTTLVAAQENIRTWFLRLRVVDTDGSLATPPGLFRLLDSLAPPGQGDALTRIDPKLSTQLLDAALRGAPLPRSVLAQVAARLRAEQGAVTTPRASLLKACLVSPDHPNLEDFMTGLDRNDTDPAYLCGRLLAVFDQTAGLATSAQHSVIDRSYASASTMPQVTFTRLLRLHRAHLDKLRRDRPGAAFNLNTEVTEIMNGFESSAGIPTTLALPGQARFALGLYHQQAAQSANRTAAKQAKASRTVTTAATTDPDIDAIIDENEE